MVLVVAMVRRGLMRIRNAWPAVVALLVLGASPAAAATPGAMDRSFSGNGVAFVRAATTVFGRAAVLDSEGRLVVAGGASRHGMLARLLPDGDLDPSFGGDGKVRLPGGSIMDVAFTPDGRIVGVGFHRDGDQYAWYAAMVTADGELDATFGTNGVAEVAYAGGQSYALGVAVDPHGRVVAVGVRNEHAAVARYLPTGMLDPSFSGDGRRVLSFGMTGADPSYDDQLLDVAVATDGDLIAVGEADRRSIAVVRLDDTGHLVKAFGGGGSIVQPPPIGTFAYGGSVLVQGDRIVIGATIDNSLGMLAYTSDGTPDKSFGGGDGIVYDVGPEDQSAQDAPVASAPGGSYVMAGAVWRQNQLDVVVCRLDHNGVEDATFGDGGGRIVPLPRNDVPSDVAVRPDGRIVVTGSRFGGSKDKIEVLQLHD
jgi:uncharacterized delta-60 repeat protein